MLSHNFHNNNIIHYNWLFTSTERHLLGISMLLKSFGTNKLFSKIKIPIK